jgi:hypothetical protein
MSKYHDDSTYATLPGELSLSDAKLRLLQPELFGEGTFLCGANCAKNHPAAEMREFIAEHMQLGCASAAVVLSLDPVLVAAYACDLDGVVLLVFPRAFAEEHRLQVGSRLLTVNTFERMNFESSGELAYACDIIPGPRRTDWSNFAPFIGEFMSDDAEGIAARKAAIDEQTWQRARELGEERVKTLGALTARDGRPTKAGVPTRCGPGGLFRRPRTSDAPSEAPPAGRPPVRVPYLIAIAVAVLVILAVSAMTKKHDPPPVEHRPPQLVRPEAQRR